MNANPLGVFSPYTQIHLVKVPEVTVNNVTSSVKKGVSLKLTSLMCLYVLMRSTVSFLRGAADGSRCPPS